MGGWDIGRPVWVHPGRAPGVGKPIAEFYIDDRGVSCVPQRDPDAYAKALNVVRLGLKR